MMISSEQRCRERKMRVACISATPLSMAPITAAFATFNAENAAAPAFELQHLLDDSLSGDLNGPRCNGLLDPSFDSRFLSLARGRIRWKSFRLDSIFIFMHV